MVEIEKKKEIGSGGATTGDDQLQRSVEDSGKGTGEEGLPQSSVQTSGSQGVGKDGRSCPPSPKPGLDNTSGDASANDMHTKNNATQNSETAAQEQETQGKDAQEMENNNQAMGTTALSLQVDKILLKDEVPLASLEQREQTQSMVEGVAIDGSESNSQNIQSTVTTSSEPKNGSVEEDGSDPKKQNNNPSGRSNLAKCIALSGFVIAAGFACYSAVYMPNAEMLLPVLDVGLKYSHLAAGFTVIFAVGALSLFALNEVPLLSTGPSAKISGPVTQVSSQQELA